MPDANDRYQRLISELNESGVSSGLEAQLTRSATLNLLLSPLSLALARMGGLGLSIYTICSNILSTGRTRRLSSDTALVVWSVADDTNARPSTCMDSP